VDSQGDIFIADYGNSAIREVNSATGVITTVAGNGLYGYMGDGGPATAAELNEPVGLAMGSQGDLFIDDLGNNVIRQVTNVASTLPPPTVTPIATSPQVLGIASVGKSRKGLTSFSLAFNKPLSASSANTPTFYHVFAGVKEHRKIRFIRALKIRSFDSPAGKATVTITLVKPYKGAVAVSVQGTIEAADGTTSPIDFAQIVR
jgi:hypothetical protein